MTVTRADIFAEARSWVGTPYHHQARLKGVGVDCGGLIGGVAVQCGIVPPDWWETTFDPEFGGYGPQPANGTLARILASFMQPIAVDAIQPGDAVLMTFGREPQHCAIVTGYAETGWFAIVHALRNSKAVAEHRLSPCWRRRIVAAFAFPGVV